VFENERMCNVRPGLSHYSPSCAAAVQIEVLGSSAQKTKSPPVSDADEAIQIQSQRFGTGERPAAAPVLVTKLDHIRSTGDDLVQLSTFKLH
jgi:hypothetical protein